MMMNNFNYFYMQLFKLFISLEQHKIGAKHSHWRKHLNTQRDRFQLRALFSFNLINQLKFNSNAFKHYEYRGTANTKHDANIWMRRGVHFNLKFQQIFKCRVSLVAINNQLCEWQGQLHPSLTWPNTFETFSIWNIVMYFMHWPLGWLSHSLNDSKILESGKWQYIPSQITMKIANKC